MIIASVLNQIWQRLTNRPDTEHEQILLRIIISAGVLIYLLAVGYGQGTDSREWLIGTVFSALLLFSLILFIALLINPGESAARRVIGIVVDIGITTYWLAVTDILGTPWYPIYLWVTLGNGFRYGEKYLYVAGALSVFGFSFVILTTPFWIENIGLSIGLLVALIALPGYASVLIRRINNERHRAEEASRAKSEFLARMSHEIRTPLNGIIGTGDLLRSRNLKPDEAEYVDTICASGQNLLSLIEDILDISKIEAGKVELEVTDFDLHALINSTVKMLSPQAELKGLRLTSRISLDTPFKLVGDPMHLRQILINLIGNAIKFTDKGAVAMRCHRLRETENRSLIHFEVVDTGIGIPLENQQRIFEKFTQADGSTTRRFGGTGLGTTIAKQLVELMGGRIGIQSTPGIGTTFWFDIEFEHQVMMVTEQEMQQMRECRVLRLCEDPERETNLAHSLRGWGVPFLNITHVEEALQRLADGKDSGQPVEVLVIENYTETPQLEQLIEAVNSESNYADLKILIIHEPGAQPTISLQGQGASRIHMLREPVDKVLLFNALHASHVAGYDAHGVINLAEHLQRGQKLDRPLQILLAEDNAINRLVIGRMLDQAGHQHQEVENGQELLDALEANSYDLVIVDMQMPLVSGLEAYKMYRFAHTDETPIPFIMLTANATVEARRSCEEVGIEWFLTKPVTSSRLLQTIHQATAHLMAQEGETPADRVAEGSASYRVEPLIDPDVLKEIIDLAPNGAFLFRLLEKLEQDGAQLLEGMVEAVSADNLKLYRELAHALKGSAANLGLTRLQGLALEAEKIDEQQLKTHGGDQIDRLRSVLEESQIALFKKFGDPNVCRV